MAKWLASVLDSPRAQFIFLGVSILVECVVAYIHTLLPYYTNLVLLYSFPIIAVTWVSGPAFGMLLAFISTCFWVVVQGANRPDEIIPTVHLWNASVRGFMFFGMVALVGYLKQVLREKERTVARLEARKSFLATISHEMRDPLQKITTGIEVLDSAHIADSKRELGDAVQQLSELVDATLELARLETGPVSLRSDFNPVTVVRDVTDYLQPTANKKDQLFFLEIDSNTPSLVRADESCLRMAARHLLRDASEFSESGSIIVKVGYTVADRKIHVAVRDGGKTRGDAREKEKPNTVSARDGAATHLIRELARSNGGDLTTHDIGGMEMVFTMTVEIL